MKKILLLIFVVFMSFPTFAGRIYAEWFEYTYEGQNLTYTINNYEERTVTVNSGGEWDGIYAERFDYTYEGQTLTYTINNYEKRTVTVNSGGVWDGIIVSGNVSGDLIIPSVVKYEDIEFTVTEIGKYAFLNCKNLTSVKIPDSITSIEFCAFDGCSSLTSVTISRFVNKIELYAFNGCHSMQSIIVSEDNENYEDIDGVLYNKDISELIQCPGGKASISIPNTVTSIGQSGFSGCCSLTSVTIPEFVKKIGHYAFTDCIRMRSIIVSEGNENYADVEGVLYNKEISELIQCPGGKTSVIIPNSVTSIGPEAFYGCSSLSSVTISNSVASIGSNAFEGCSSLTSVTIPNSVTSLGIGAFYDCSSLTSVTIPNSVTSIGANTFNGCSSLISVTIPNSVTFIGSRAFSGCSSLTSVTIPNSVTKIAMYAFYGCSSLAKVNIPNSITSIEYGTFRYCSGLISVNIPNSVTSIDVKSFYGCSALTSVAIPESVTYIYDNAFEGCDGLKKCAYPSNLKNPFVNVASIVYNPLSAKTVDGYVFNSDKTEVLFAPYDADGNYTIPEGVIKIGVDAYSYSDNMTSIVIPDNVTTICNGAFKHCSRLQDITLPKSLSSMQGWVFEKSSAIKNVVYRGETAAEAPSNTFDRSVYENATLYVPEGKVTLFQTVSPWENFFKITDKKYGDGVEDIYQNNNEIDYSAPCRVYNLGGVFVSDTINGLTPGIYIVHQGSTVKKIAIY